MDYPDELKKEVRDINRMSVLGIVALVLYTIGMIIGYSIM
jgi:hypothetical protein